ncbi:MAG TPA: hypothetical protein VMS65_06000 [Polyangiaceae bacterium]|nr:hypothetical protein [Polyangiaceae bacterium]
MAAAAFTVVLGTAGLASADEAISEEAKLYFRNGVELIQGTPPNYQDAYYQFKLAYEKSKSWKVLGNLGLCSFKLERDGEALDAYNEYLKSGGAEIDPDERKALERDVLVITGNSAAVNLASSVPEVEIIDARAGSSVPPQTYKFQAGTLALRLRAGTHTLTATTPDGKQERWEVQLSPGKTIEHQFNFGGGAVAVVPPPGTPPPGEPAPAPADESGGGSPLRTVGFVALGVGGAALIGGVVTGFMAKGKEDDATSQCVGKVCPSAAEKDFDSASSLAGVSTALYIGGGVLAAAGVGLVVFGGGGKESPPATARAPKLELSPYLGPTGAGVFASGAF